MSEPANLPRDPPRTSERVEPQSKDDSGLDPASGYILGCFGKFAVLIVCAVIGGLILTVFDADLGRRGAEMVGGLVLLAVIAIFSLIGRLRRRDEPPNPDQP